MLSYSAVHSPLQGTDEYLQRFIHIPDMHRRIFAAMLAHLDAGVGRVLERLRTEGIADQTLVVFLSDNGGATRELTSSNHPFRGEKGQLLEGGIRVPMIARWPAHLPADRTESRMMSSHDLLPTALGAAGGTESARRQALIGTFERIDAEMVEPLWGPAGRG
jgi:arylsulfatase A-like enzyme